MFMALLLMYLKEIKTIIGLVRFLRNDPRWLRILNLKKRVNDGVEVYSVPNRTRIIQVRFKGGAREEGEEA